MNTYRFTISWELDFAGSEMTVWTAPSQLRCGDLVLLYEAVNGGRGAFVAVGRAVTDALRAYKGDENYWAWIEWRVAKKPISLAAARKRAKFSVMGSGGRLEPGAFKRLSNALVAGDPPAANALRRWRDGKGLPTTDQVPIRDLVLASLGPTYEWHSYEPIADALAASGWRPETDEVKGKLRNLRGDLSFDPGRTTGLRTDIRLCRPRAKRLLVVEVKRAAVPTPGYRNPADQVVDYARACRKALGRPWTVEPLLVAEEFSPVVVAEAQAKKTPVGVARPACRVWDGQRLGRNLVRYEG